MKGKYSNRYVEMACLASRNRFMRPDIHQQLKETIAEHKKIMQRYFFGNNDIHQQLVETIAALKKTMEKYIRKGKAKQTWIIVPKSDAA